MSECENLLTLIEIVNLVESQQFFAYVAVADEVVCPHCLRYDQGLMTRTEIEDTFEYLVKVTDTLWIPNLHKNCRCVLNFFEEEPAPQQALTQPAEPSRSIEKPTEPTPPTSPIDKYLKHKNDEPVLTPNGDPTLKNGVFDVLIAGLIGAGAIVAGYSWREKKRAYSDLTSSIFGGRKMSKQEVLKYLQTVSDSSSLWFDIQQLLREKVSKEL